MEKIITLANELNINTIIPAIKDLNDFLEQDKVLSAEINFNSTVFAYPGGLTPLLAYLKENGQTKHSIFLNSGKSSIDGYIRRMGFYSLLGLQDNYPWCKLSGRGKFQEPYYFSKNTNPNTVNEKTGNIISLFIKDRNKMNYNEAIGWCISEIIDNAQNHANSDINVVMAQNYRDNTLTEFSVSDRGIGIRASMGEKDAKTALEKCITPAKGINSDGMGNGLYYTAELIKQDTSGKCLMNIWSEDHLLTLYSGATPEVKKVNGWWQGVNISISMYNGISSSLTELKGGKDAFSYENMSEYYENLFEN